MTSRRLKDADIPTCECGADLTGTDRLCGSCRYQAIAEFQSNSTERAEAQDEI